jgi:threonine dehydratase
LRTSLGSLTFQIIQKHLHDLILVSERSIVENMRKIWERMKIIIEPSCAVPLAAVMNRKEAFRGKRIGIILTGGNVDLDHLPWN